MLTVVVVIHLFLAIALIAVVLLQKSEGGALGMGGGGMAGFMSGRSTANLLTRSTAILAACFFATSIALALIAGAQRTQRSIIDQGGPPPASSPAPNPAAPAAPSPAPPSGPSAPLAQ
jgi:preprotein translocase subunit SecG